MAGWGGIAPFALERHFARHEFSAPWRVSSSDCDGWPLQTVLQWADAETRALWDDLHLGYSDSRGIPQLRRQIASQYEGFTADQVLTMVPQEAILVAMQALLSPGDHVVCTYPGYQSLFARNYSPAYRADSLRPRFPPPPQLLSGTISA